MKTAYLIYRPVMDYEDSESPYLITLTEEAAKAVVLNICLSCQKIASQLLHKDVSLPEKEWETAVSHNEKTLKNAKWPYGLDNLIYDIQDDQERCKNTKEYKWVKKINIHSVKYKELPFCE